MSGNPDVEATPTRLFREAHIAKYFHRLFATKRIGTLEDNSRRRSDDAAILATGFHTGNLF